ncbi:MAG: glycosyltransferase 87 family protein [Thermomicrobiales bacterium]
MSTTTLAAGSSVGEAQTRGRSSALILLWICGLASAVICGAFAWRYPLRGHTGELIDIGKLADYRIVPFVGFVAGMIGLFACYVGGLLACRRVDPKQARRALFVCGALQIAAMGWMYPVNAIDLFIYAVRSRLLTQYGADPLVALPRDYLHDPYMIFASQEWAVNVSPYGPLWNLIAAPVTLIGGNSIGVALAGYKVLAALSALLGAWLIVRTVAGDRPRDAATAGILFLWNPLVLWEGVGNGHNDLVMVVPVVAALWAWSRRRDAWVIPLLVVAATIKYVPVIVIPLAALAILRRAPSWHDRLRLALFALVGSALVMAVAMFPFYDPEAMWESVTQQGDIFLTSPAAMAIGVLQDYVAADDVRWWVIRICYGIFAATLLWQAVRVLRQPGWLPHGVFEVFFVFLLVATWNFRGWYLIWPVAVAALLPSIWPAARSIAWTAGAMSVYALFIWIWHWWEADFVTIQNVAVPMITGPAVLLTFVQIGIALWRRFFPTTQLSSFDSEARPPLRTVGEGVNAGK